jgi:ankyrin repeat protein
MSTQRRIVKNPLLLAAGQGNLADVQNLVREGADVNKASKDDDSSLHGS